jgi:aminodeoxyfutalosine synthase
MLDTITRKIDAGERLSAEEGEYLYRPEVDVHMLGRLADQVRRRINGTIAWYNVNAHLNPTNLCAYRCPLCAYSRDPGEAGAYVMSRDEILERGREADAAGATELHIVSGIYPALGYDWYLEIIASLHRAFPRLHLKAWTAAEIAWFAEATGRPVRAVLEEMIALGLGSLPGGGA